MIFLQQTLVVRTLCLDHHAVFLSVSCISVIDSPAKDINVWKNCSWQWVCCRILFFFNIHRAQSSANGKLKIIRYFGYFQVIINKGCSDRSSSFGWLYHWATPFSLKSFKFISFQVKKMLLELYKI